jgi:uncharacterized protein (TIGR00251 family)
VSSGFVSRTREGVLVRLRVSPGAKVTALAGSYGEDALKLKAAAPPVDGKANSEIERYLAEVLGVPRSEVEIFRGAASRDKTVLVRGASTGEVRKVLTAGL